MPDIKIRCPRCREVIEAPSDTAGMKGECPFCGVKMIIPGSCEKKRSKTKDFMIFVGIIMILGVFTCLTQTNNTIESDEPIKPVNIESLHPKYVFDINSLFGITPSLLANKIPSVNIPPMNQHSERPSIYLKDSCAWSYIAFSFNGKDHLAGITFKPLYPIDIETAEKTMKINYSLHLPVMRKNTLVSRRYFHISDYIRTVNFNYCSMDDKRVNEIGVFYDIEWTQ